MSVPTWIALVLSFLALGASAFAIYRMRLLEFRPEVLAGDIILPRCRLPCRRAAG